MSSPATWLGRMSTQSGAGIQRHRRSPAPKTTSRHHTSMSPRLWLTTSPMPALHQQGDRWRLAASWVCAPLIGNKSKSTPPLPWSYEERTRQEDQDVENAGVLGSHDSVYGCELGKVGDANGSLSGDNSAVRFPGATHSCGELTKTTEDRLAKTQRGMERRITKV